MNTRACFIDRVVCKVLSLFDTVSMCKTISIYRNFNLKINDVEIFSSLIFYTYSEQNIHRYIDGDIYICYKNHRLYIHFLLFFFEFKSAVTITTTKATFIILSFFFVLYIFSFRFSITYILYGFKYRQRWHVGSSVSYTMAKR